MPSHLRERSSTARRKFIDISKRPDHKEGSGRQRQQIEDEGALILGFAPIDYGAENAEATATARLVMVLTSI